MKSLLVDGCGTKILMIRVISLYKNWFLFWWENEAKVIFDQPKHNIRDSLDWDAMKMYVTLKLYAELK